MLKFSPANAKTKALKVVFPKMRGKVYSFDLPAGYTCPGAKLCKSMAVLNPLTDRYNIKDGKDCQFRCFSASQEIIFPAVHMARRHNLNTLNGCKDMTQEILDSLPSDAGIVRLHVAGDFFSVKYLRAWIKVATLRPNVIFYAYTKSLNLLKQVLPLVGSSLNLAIGRLLPNFFVTASRGGKYDELIPQLGIRTATVVYTENEAKSANLAVDHTDQFASQPGGSFALLIHGIQPAGSFASKALVALKGKGSYSR